MKFSRENYYINTNRYDSIIKAFRNGVNHKAPEIYTSNHTENNM